MKGGGLQRGQEKERDKSKGDVRHSRQEKRYYALGQTSRGRYLFVAFTIRRKMIRVISVRDMNRNEQEHYGKHEEANP